MKRLLLADFADFAGVPQPAPEVHVAHDGGATLAADAAGATAVPFSKWYNVHERHSISEFKAEGIILAVIAVIMAVHIVGARANRTKARKWIAANAEAISSQFALVGFGGVPAMEDDTAKLSPEKLIKEKSLHEFATYASGRQNVAFMDVSLTLTKKFNPFLNAMETAFALFSTMFPTPRDVMEAAIYPFDGKENLIVPAAPGAEEARGNKNGKSTYDDFVWAIVHKDVMQTLREDRYDVSLTVTKDSGKLPSWLTIMTESAEITDALLTAELIEAVAAAGDQFEYLIVSDQPMDKPKKLKETMPRKRIYLRYRLPASNNYEPVSALFSYFLKLPDLLVQQAHFRPEVTRRVAKTRQGMIDQLKKESLEEVNEERALEREKSKKAKRDAELSALDAKAQKKYLEKEREKEIRKSQKKSTVRG